MTLCIAQFECSKKQRGEVMRLLLAIGMMGLLSIAAGSARAEVAKPLTVSELAALCKTDADKCGDQIGLIIMTGVGAQKLPSCTVHVNLPPLIGKLLAWWQAHPEQATVSAVLGVANALNDLKPC
jgi:hypothetical protein